MAPQCIDTRCDGGPWLRFFKGEFHKFVKEKRLVTHWEPWQLDKTFGVQSSAKEYCRSRIGRAVGVGNWNSIIVYNEKAIVG